MSRKFLPVLLAAALLFTATLAESALAAPRKVTIDPAGSLLLPQGWTIMDPGIAARQVTEAKEHMGIALSSNTVFFAVKNSPTMEQLACIVLERTQASPVNNNIIPLLTPEEKEEIYANTRLIMTGAFKMAGQEAEITEIAFKTFDRYHTLIISMRQAAAGHNPTDSHLVYYFLPQATHMLTVTYNAEAVKELNPDFTVIMDSFDPDSGYQPADAPARKEGETLHDYLGRIYEAE